MMNGQKCAVHQHGVPFQGHVLAADRYVASGRCAAYDTHVLALHGGGASQRGVFAVLREQLGALGVGSTALDCIGHGQTGGAWADSSLQGRDQQALSVLEHLGVQPTAIIGSSMGAYGAIQLSRILALQALVLLVPGVYTPEAYALAFGPAFSQMIRRPGSWRDSDAWELLAHFQGRLLVVAAQHDEVIPTEIPQRLYACATQAASRELLVVPDAGHQGMLARLLAEPTWRTRLLDVLGATGA